ncbi:MAG: hypothetical protein DHS20C09_10290 [marine bacterium B5-7]|jgi:hypothetical protein|nr:MAG: hypothetical protein DHS20C09_10290 [marine bacterium B5-7]
MEDQGRKIIQIAISPDNDNQQDFVYALCNDGTLWVINVSETQSEWVILSGIPQDD